jgi:hypothetical protein
MMRKGQRMIKMALLVFCPENIETCQKIYNTVKKESNTDERGPNGGKIRKINHFWILFSRKGRKMSKK